jgi:hypothetical protein
MLIRQNADGLEDGGSLTLRRARGVLGPFLADITTSAVVCQNRKLICRNVTGS